MGGSCRRKDRGIRKSGLFQARSPSHRGRQGLIREMTSLVLAREVQTGWPEIPSWKRLKLQFSYTVLVRLSTSNSILGLLFLSNSQQPWEE